MTPSYCWSAWRVHFRVSLFLIFINDLSSIGDDTDDNSLFSIINDVHLSVFHLNSDLTKISKWASDIILIFWNRLKKLYFLEKLLKHLILRLHNFLPSWILQTIYKCFNKPNLDYSDFIYDQPYNDSFWSKTESVQYNAALSITGAIGGTPQTKLDNEQGLESLRSWRWFRHLSTPYKIKVPHLPSNFNNMLPKVTHHYQTKILGYIPNQEKYFQILFLPLFSYGMEQT